VHDLHLDNGRGPLPTRKPGRLVAVVIKAAPLPVKIALPILKGSEMEVGAGNPGAPFDMLKEKL
jgi:hypothetical protein